MIIRILLALLFVFRIFNFESQTNQSANFRSPLDIPLVLAANFGELRPNHFHMGVDFKTNGEIGYKLHSVEEGYVSRVKISPYGYGKVVYIDHPNGITSVYAHCSELKGKLDSVVRSIQKREESFEVEIYFLKNEISLKKGDVFALSGNTGSSTAPHLHFELRNTETEEALNPLLFGFNLDDHKAPEIRGVKVYGLTEKGYRIPGKTLKADVSRSKEGFQVKGGAINVPSHFCSEKGGIGFSFDVVDYFDAALNVCGLYGSVLKSGKDTIFCQQIDKVSFSDSRFVNSHKDYEEYVWNKRKFHKSFRTQSNPLEIYPTENLGVISVKPGDNYALKMEVYDVKHNKSSLAFDLNVLPGTISPLLDPFPAKEYFQPDSSYSFQTLEYIVTIDKGTFYEPTQKNLALKDNLRIGNPASPVQKPIHVEMKIPSSIKNKKKAYVEVVSAGNKKHFLKTTINGDRAVAESMYLGSFSVKEDTVPPKVSALSIQGSTMRWSVSERETELTDYDLYVDGVWYPMEYESKGDYFIFKKPKGLSGKHVLKVHAMDACNNTGVWSAEVVF